MMYKIVGTALVILSCGGVGFNAASAHKREVRLLKELITSIHYMKCELEYRSTPLPELLGKTAKISSGHMQAFFLRLVQVLQSQIFPDPGSCCAHVIAQNKILPASVRDIIMTVGATLGQFDLQGQLDGLQLAIAHAEELLEKLTTDQDNRLRNYQTLGLCAGAALAILLV